MPTSARAQASRLTVAWALVLAIHLLLLGIRDFPADAAVYLGLISTGLISVAGIALALRVRKGELLGGTAWFIGVIESLRVIGFISLLARGEVSGSAWAGVFVVLAVLQIALGIGALRFLVLCLREGDGSGDHRAGPNAQLPNRP